jgi:hypothetical protein
MVTTAIFVADDLKLSIEESNTYKPIQADSPLDEPSRLLVVRMKLERLCAVEKFPIYDLTYICMLEFNGVCSSPVLVEEQS